MAALCFVLALALACAGFAALALAMERHHRQVWHRAPGRGLCWSLRLAGAGGLGAALAVCVACAGVAVGVVLWAGLLSAAAVLVVLGLAALG